MHLYCDNEMAVNIFQAGHGKDTFIQACTRPLWFICATHYITLAVGHIAGEHFTSSAAALSRWHMGQHYKDRVNMLIQDKGVNIVNVPSDAFEISPSL